jgi:cystathionine beta-synthase
VLVAGVGTGGTISGVGLYLKEKNPAIKVVGADPEGSVLSGDSPKPWKVEGIGEDFVPKTFNGQVVDEWVRVGDAESFRTARELACREGLLVGGSSGTAVAAAIRYGRRLTAHDIVVAICPDTGRNYMSKIFDDDWMAENKFLASEPVTRTVGDLLRTRGPRPLCSVGTDASVAVAVERMQSRGISQLPVLSDGRAVGSIQEVTVARLMHDGVEPDTVRVGDVMARPLPQLDVRVHLDEAYRLLLSGNSGVLATEEGVVADIITRIDLISYWKVARAG